MVLDITAADEETAHAIMAELERWWASFGITPVRSEPGAPGVRARVYADIRRLAPVGSLLVRVRAARPLRPCGRRRGRCCCRYLVRSAPQRSVSATWPRDTMAAKGRPAGRGPADAPISPTASR
ncbi:DUF6207 family protein [Streptomyces yanii]|uniref:DUF6207 family protein n=1 Tax=Streptomyces yanii TaxID=78510 RepID=A0ABV5RPX2_9ACTN